MKRENRLSMRGCLAVLALGLQVWGLSGCMVGPNYHTPKVDVPEKWTEASVSDVQGEVAVISQWWSVFQDPMLNELTERAVRSNLDLKIAEARIREARAQRGVVAADAYPVLDVSATYTRSQRSTNATSTTSVSSSSGSGDNPEKRPSGSTSSGGTVTLDPQDLFQVGFDASWEIDVFGGVRRSIEAATADIEASVESRRDVLVTLLSEVARNYLQLRGSQVRLAIARENIKAQEQTVELTKARFEAGLSSELDVAQAQAQLASTISRVPELETIIRQSTHQVEVLLGQEPGVLTEELTADAPLPAAPPEVPLGLPSDLLRRRPDIRQAERELAAATARIGVAVADLFPQFSLTGSLGQQSLDFSDLARTHSRFWSIGPTVRWPIFQGGRIRANIQVQNARQDQALIQYERAVLTSLQDVENALVAFSKEQLVRASLSDAVEANNRAYTIARELYASGLTDFLNVLESQRALYLSQDSLALSDQRVTTNLVALFKALGGGWDVPPQS